MINAVLFDLDDTLVDHDTAIRNTASTLFNKIIPNSNYELTAFQEQWISLTRKWYKKFFAKQVSFQESGRGRLREAFSNYGYEFSDIDADNLLSEYWADYISKCQLFDDVVECFRQLQKYKIGVLTNGQEVQQIEVIKSCKIHPILDVVVTSEAAGFAKPEPQIFQYTCAKLGVEPTQTVYVGDNLELDAIAANNAGLIGIWLNRRYKNSETHFPIIKQINNLNDSLKLLDK
ncbi:HAD family hydrolase [Nostoc sp. LEGE 06077]|uniref:HAD family hydrolase n=1 Tax=Nostoc sp. LEGE 06077 TaxID=915325 RepID=UPI00187ED021|nr:HAD family hydrolase [Nostoc sp. LEGE 06077]MBE9208752.1 HAD family hydrolase [Nostoc sp. LEGE 06077]